MIRGRKMANLMAPGENDLKTTLAIAKKVTDAGLGVLLNFHYSDFWADPGKQIKPKAWKDYMAWNS